MTEGLKEMAQGGGSAPSVTPTDRLKRVFDRSYYLSANMDVKASGIPPEQHYLAHGIREDRAPSAWFSGAYVRRQLNAAHLAPSELLERYMASDMPDRPRVLFVGHEASRTGAPAILLRLIELFSAEGNVECITLLDEGGERLGDFQQVSHVYAMAKSRREEGFDTNAGQVELETLFGEQGALKQNPPIIALVNSAESARIARVLHRLGIPIVTLLHEFAAFYSKSVFETLSEISEKLIVPSQFIRRTALEHARLDERKLVVRGQGLLDDGFGTLNTRACRRQLRGRLDLPADAFIVLNVGTLELRKGIDSFARAASLFCRNYPEHDHVYFLWYGEETAASASALPFARQVIADHDLEDRIRFLPSTAMVEPIFQAADLFFLSARADPFPCVVHEALACGLPVIAFRGSGGAPELIGEDCGTLVELGDHLAVSRAVHSYLAQPALLREQAENSVRKIRNHWSYAEYFQFVRAEMQKHVSVPLSGKHAEHVSPETNLVLCPPAIEALETMETSDLQIACTHVLLSRPPPQKSVELHAALDRLIAGGIHLQVGVPAEGGGMVCSETLLRALQEIRPATLSVIGLETELDREVLQLMDCRKRLILTSGTADRRALYKVGTEFDEIVTSDGSLGSVMNEMNPRISERIKLVDAA